MEYNTQRKKLPLPEYGRHIQKMVDYIKTIESKEERNKLSRSLISIMGNLNPHLRDVADFKHKLWDHLAIMSNFELDIDYPYDIIEPKMLTEKPQPIPYKTGDVVYKHYGKNLEKFINYAVEMEPGEEKNLLIEMIANHMKKSYLMWNKDSVNDELIFKDFRKLSDGKIEIPSDLKLNEVRDILMRNKKKQRTQRNKK